VEKHDLPPKKVVDLGPPKIYLLDKSVERKEKYEQFRQKFKKNLEKAGVELEEVRKKYKYFMTLVSQWILRGG